LGLSLVAAVVRLHGARVELVDNAPGLKVEIRFPAVDATRRDNGKLAEVGGAKK
jgi:signal transduction histidine kinase